MHGSRVRDVALTYETTGSATAQYNLMDGPTRSGICPGLRDAVGWPVDARLDPRCTASPSSTACTSTSSRGPINGSSVAWVDHDCEKVLDHEACLRKLQAITDLAQLGG